MLGKIKKFFIAKVIIFFVISPVSFAAEIVPMGKVSIIKDGYVVGEFNQKGLLPEGFLLRCEAMCVIRLDDVSLEVEPKTAFSVSQMTNHHDLIIRQGTVYYSLNKSTRPLHLDTPIETMTINKLDMTSSELKGYVRAVDDAMEIGVFGGGAITLDLASERFSVLSGEKLTIAVAATEKQAFANKKGENLEANKIYMIETIDNYNDRFSQIYSGDGHDSDSGGSGDNDSASGIFSGGSSGGGGSGEGGSSGGGSGGGGSGGGDSGGGDSDGGGSGGGDSDGGGSSGGGSSGGDSGGGGSSGGGSSGGGSSGGGSGGGGSSGGDSDGGGRR